MIELAESLDSSNTSAPCASSTNPLEVIIHYCYTVSGKEVFKMCSFIAESQQQYEKYNNDLYPETSKNT